MGVADYSKQQLKIVRIPDWRELVYTASKWLRSLAATYKSSSTVLPAATGNCAVTNVTYNENKDYVVTWTVYLEFLMYLRRRQCLRHIIVMCHIAFSFRSGAVLKFDRFYQSSVFSTKLRLVSL